MTGISATTVTRWFKHGVDIDAAVDNHKRRRTK